MRSIADDIRRAADVLDQRYRRLDRLSNPVHRRGSSEPIASVGGFGMTLRAWADEEVGGMAMRAMRTSDAISRMQSPGGFRHVLPFAMNLHQTPYGTLSTALDGMRPEAEEH